MVTDLVKLEQDMFNSSESIQAESVLMVQKAYNLGEKVSELQKYYKEHDGHLETGLKWKKYIQSLGFQGVSYSVVTEAIKVYDNWSWIVGNGYNSSRTYSQLVCIDLPKHLKTLQGNPEADVTWYQDESEYKAWQEKKKVYRMTLASTTRVLNKYIYRYGRDEFCFEGEEVVS